MFRKVLVANRGEIAVRVFRTLQQMGIPSLAVYAESDRDAVHPAAADEAALLRGTSVGETYLDVDQLLAVARERGADAVHPGYGFLSENARFAERCAETGLTFIGPPVEAIRAMGDKVRAKEIMSAAGVPVVPGVTVPERVETGPLLGEAAAIGYPILVKAAAGGGGKGMRLVREESELLQAVRAAAREAHSAFGDGRVFLEKYVTSPRHVEMQVLGDAHGHVVHMYERECSIQRRHQKIVEESPSPLLDDALRARMGEAAVAAARAVGYVNAGTVEFIVDADRGFYFLEVNTRLQVEHPVTEMVLCLDLVRAQVLVAAGAPLPWTQEDLRPRGHALEVRVYAEDAARDFMPSTGVLRAYEPPSAPFLRVDSGVARGSEVTVYHDPMLAKVITWGASREESIDRMRWALRRFPVLGVTTNIAFLHDLLGHEAFREGRLHTHFLEEHSISPGHGTPPAEAWLLAALALQGRLDADGPSSTEAARPRGPWDTAGAWRLG